jgi:hypothetical protein
MGRKSTISNERARQVLAQEAARIIVDQGIQDYRAAKTKAAERLGMRDHGSLPCNTEIEQAVAMHLQLFGRESHIDFIRLMRHAAIATMHMLAGFTPRLVGPVLQGTAAANARVNLHLFSDSPESVAWELQENQISYRTFDRRLRQSRCDHTQTYAAFAFAHSNSEIEATVFPVDGVRQAPISPIDGKPMRRADVGAVMAMLQS